MPGEELYSQIGGPTKSEEITPEQKTMMDSPRLWMKKLEERVDPAGSDEETLGDSLYTLFRRAAQLSSNYSDESQEDSEEKDTYDEAKKPDYYSYYQGINKNNGQGADSQSGQIKINGLTVFEAFDSFLSS